MDAVLKTSAAAIAAGFAVLSAHAAAEYRPAYCPRDHDHRAHDANYYDYYDADRYYRAGRYQGRYNDGYNRRGYYRPRSEVVFREHIDLRRYRAYITVVEEKYWTRSGRVQRVCSVLARGPEAYDVPHRRLERAANRNCSRRARIQYL